MIHRLKPANARRKGAQILEPLVDCHYRHRCQRSR